MALNNTVVENAVTGSTVANSSKVVGSGSTAGINPSGTPKAHKGFRLELQQMLAGVQSVLPDGSSLMVTGAKALSKAEVLRVLEDGVAAYSAVDGQLTALTGARTQLKGKLLELHTNYAELKGGLTLLFGAGSPQLAQFGLKPKTLRKPRTSAQKVASAAKAKLTRQARNPLTKQQKAAAQFIGKVEVATKVNSLAPMPVSPVLLPVQTGAVTVTAPHAGPVATPGGNGNGGTSP